MMMAFERTRFLEALDRMVWQDGEGAIADMLQVLRERGAIREYGAAGSAPTYQLTEGHAPGLREHMDHTIAAKIGRGLLDEGVLTISERKEPATARWTEADMTMREGRVYVVVWHASKNEARTAGV